MSAEPWWTTCTTCGQQGPSDCIVGVEHRAPTTTWCPPVPCFFCGKPAALEGRCAHQVPGPLHADNVTFRTEPVCLGCRSTNR